MNYEDLYQNYKDYECDMCMTDGVMEQLKQKDFNQAIQNRRQQEAEANKRQISDKDMAYLRAALEAGDVNQFINVI
jgi:hypothetical protein